MIYLGFHNFSHIIIFSVTDLGNLDNLCWLSWFQEFHSINDNHIAYNLSTSLEPSWHVYLVTIKIGPQPPWGPLPSIHYESTCLSPPPSYRAHMTQSLPPLHPPPSSLPLLISSSHRQLINILEWLLGIGYYYYDIPVHSIGWLQYIASHILTSTRLIY